MSELNKLISIRVTQELHTLIRAVSKDRGEDLSDFIRRSILKELANLSFLSEDQKKALGVKEVVVAK